MSAQQPGRKAPFIPFFRPSLGVEEEEAVVSVLRSGWLTTGEVTARFEREFAAVTGARHALAVNSATAGLHLALEALGVGNADAVITSPYTFAATAEVIRYLGADPLFVDIQSASMNIDPAALEAALETCRASKRKVSAILPVHVAGLPCDMPTIREIACRYGVPVIEDAAHAFPVRAGGRFVGTLGDVGVYSFYATKTMTTGEGGMLVTDRDEVAARARVMRLHGIDRDVWDRYTSQNASWRYDIVAPGFKYNLSDIASAIGLAQLAKAQDFLLQRTRIARRYREAFAGLDFLELPTDAENHAWHLFVIHVVTDKLSVDRDAFADELMRRGIGISVHFIPLHLMSYYRQKYGLKPESFPRALESFRTCISLPLSPSLSGEEVERVITAVKDTGFSHHALRR
jgi:dTDP-4-amino-4,6-dideoxygalactose transaminase